LKRGGYSTRLAMSNLLVYNMTHDDQSMSVVLNRGAPTTINGFASNDVVRFGVSVMQNGTLSVDAHSVTVIELSVDVEVTPKYGCTDVTATNFDSSATEDDGSCEYPPEPILGCTDDTATNFDAEATQDDGNCQYETDPVDSCADVFCDACPAGWISLPAEEGECCPSCLEPSGNNQTNTTNQTSVNNETQLPNSTNETNENQSVSDGMKTCDGCCGDAYEVTLDEPCPVADCDPCEESEGSDSKSSTVMLARSVLIGAIVLVALVLILSGRRGGGIETDSIHDEYTHHEN
jgi:hypothetical protein